MKNSRLKSVGLFLFAGLTLTMQSCLKDEEWMTHYPRLSPAAVMELPLAAKYSNKPYELPWSANAATFTKISVNVASVDLPATANTAALSTEPEWIDQYNIEQTSIAQKAQQDYLAGDASHKTSDSAYPYAWAPMELLPDSLYSVSTYDLTIPANERSASTDIAIKTDKFGHGHNYVLPFTIKTSSIAISNWSHLPLWFKSSVFAGKYANFHANLKGGAYNETYDDIMTLVTIDQHTVADTLTIGDFFGGYSEYHFNADGSVSVKAGSSSAKPDDYGAKVLESSSNAATGEFYVKFTVLDGDYTFTVDFKR